MSGPNGIRAVPARRAFDWYTDALRLWRRGPVAFSAIAVVILAANLALDFVPTAGVVVAQLCLPVLECGLLYATLAADRGERPRFRHLFAVAAATPAALAAVIVAGVVVYATEALVAYAVGGFDLLAPGRNAEPISGTTLIAAYVAGIGASLPLTFVPFAALFGGAGFRGAFAQSFDAFARNAAPLALYGGLSLVLLVIGVATSGVGLILALPWSAAASYAAWKDAFGLQ